MIEAGPWRHLLTWSEARAAERRLSLEADEPTRARIARALDLEHLAKLRVEIVLRAWLDGVEIEGRIVAVAGRVCGLSFEPFDERIDEPFTMRIVPQGSPNAQQAKGHELIIDPEEADPPDEAGGESIDLGACVFEQLALGLDPFPRRPGASFEPLMREVASSPFAALEQLKPKAEE
ncbi:MAG: YceD family protein [Caulobacteraceae bacterium]